jgi:2-polyprenyl-3-methyl-5-hydroxy-6-metoxy-1,4-benzoquinol methylase
VEILREGVQIEEGFLFCPKCKMHFPIINTIPILWNDFANYLSNRPRLGGEFLTSAKTSKMRSFVKQTLSKIRKNPSDQSIVEKRWFEIYKQNKNSKFYSKIKEHLRTIANSGVVLEHGCSIGIVTQHLAKTHRVAFGIDKSYHAVIEAKKSKLKNLDFFVADSLEHPFGKTKFDLVLGLNLFELIEPKPLLKLLAVQVRKKGWLVLSDPYDFDRGAKSVKDPLYEDSIRKEITRHGFAISKKTTKPSHLLWNLRLHKRANLQYKVDLIIGKKTR